MNTLQSDVVLSENSVERATLFSGYAHTYGGILNVFFSPMFSGLLIVNKEVKFKVIAISVTIFARL